MSFPPIRQIVRRHCRSFLVLAGAACADGFPEGYVGEVELAGHSFTGAAALFGPDSTLDCPYVLQVEPAQPGSTGDSVPFASVGISFDLVELRAHSVSFRQPLGDCRVRLEVMYPPDPNGIVGFNRFHLYGRLEIRELSKTTIHLLVEGEVHGDEWDPVRFEARARR